MGAGWCERFSAYFDREVARKAAAPLSDGIEIEIQIEQELLTFTRTAGSNQVRAGGGLNPQLSFTLTPGAAETILSDPAEEIGAIGVSIARLIFSQDADKKVSLKFRAGFLSLWNKGYFGVLKAGGTEFSSYLASRGLNGLSAIKAALSKIRN